jgi:hypothetical protein
LLPFLILIISLVTIAKVYKQNSNILSNNYPIDL